MVVQLALSSLPRLVRVLFVARQVLLLSVLLLLEQLQLLLLQCQLLLLLCGQLQLCLLLLHHLTQHAVRQQALHTGHRGSGGGS